jgi:hypothetical protein
MEEGLGSFGGDFCFLKTRLTLRIIYHYEKMGKQKILIMPCGFRNDNNHLGEKDNNLRSIAPPNSIINKYSPNHGAHTATLSIIIYIS